MSMPHICTIKHETSRTYLPYKEDSKNVFHKFYRCFRHWCMAWKGHPHFSHYYKSTTVYLEERKSHASSKYFYIIHPISRLCFCMQVFVMICYIYAFLYYPMLASFQDIYGTDYKFDETEKIFHGIFTVEIIVRLFIGKRNFSRKLITLDQRKIVKSYLCSIAFIGDICGALPVPYMNLITDDCNITYTLMTIRTAKILRLRSFVKYCNEFLKVLKISAHRGFLNFFIIATIGFHWFVCTYYGVHALGGVLRNHYLAKYTWIFRFQAKNVSGSTYIETSFRTMGILLSARRDTLWSRSLEHKILCFLFGIFGRVFMLILAVLIVNRILRASELTIKYSQVLDELNEFINRKKLPPSTRNRLISFYEYKFQGKFVREAKIEKLLSDRLRKEVNYISRNRLIQQVEIFQDIPTKILTEIINNLRLEVFLPNDIIIGAGAPAECMYFISTGTVSVTTASGREVCHLQEGSYFGEAALIFNQRKSVSCVTALEICETYKLDAKTFRSCFKDNPEVFQRLRIEAERREEESNRLEKEFQEMLFLRTFLGERRKFSFESEEDLPSVSSKTYY